MASARLNETFAHWYHRFPGMKMSSDEFYSMVQQEVEKHKIGGVRIKRVLIHESGIFSVKREYLEVYCSPNVFHLCAAPYGDGFFVSYWTGLVVDGLVRFLAAFPLIGRFFYRFIRPTTYHAIDTQLMFQSVVGASVNTVLDALMAEQGRRVLSDVERKPMMRDFLS